MISPNDMQVTRYDVSLFATLLVVSSIMHSQLQKTKPFDERWQMGAVATIVGVIAHGLVTNKISAQLNTSLNLLEENKRMVVYDAVKFSTIFASQVVVLSYLQNRPIVFDEKFLLTSGLTIAGYSAFHMLSGMVPNVGEKHQPLVNDMIKFSMGKLLATYIVENHRISDNSLVDLGIGLAGWTVFHTFVRKYVVPKQEVIPEGFQNKNTCFARKSSAINACRRIVRPKAGEVNKCIARANLMC